MTDRTATRTLKAGDHIAARIMQVGPGIEMASGVLPLSQELSGYALGQIRRMADEARQKMSRQARKADADAVPPRDEDTAIYTAVLREAAAPISAVWLMALLRKLRGPEEDI